METEITIKANLTDEQLEVLVSEIQNIAEMIGIDLKVESNKLNQHDVISSVCECKVCGKPFGDKLSLYLHYDEKHNQQTDL